MKTMKTRKSNKLIDKLRAAYGTADEAKRERITDLGKRLTAVHQECIAFLIENQKPVQSSTPF